MANLDNVSIRATWLRRVWYLASVLGALGCGAVDDATVGGSQQALAPPGSNSELVSASFKSEWYPGERVRVSFTLRNSGTSDWTAADPTFALGSLDRGWDWRYTATPVTVPVGSSHEFDFVVSAPIVPGDYSFMARMRSLGLGDFGATITRAATVTQSVTPEWGCEYVASASDVPARLAPNENRAVVVTVRNVGQKTWQPGFYLVSEDSPAGFWHQTSLPLNATVAPGSSKTWSFGIRAPETPGAYRLRREMADNSAGGVGEFRHQGFCVDLSLEVSGSTPLDSRIAAQDFRATVAPGEAFSETVTLRNTGTETWAADGSYVLSSASSPVSLWGRTSVPVRTVTAPGASTSFVLPLRAPAATGSYEQRWQLRKLSGTNAGFFGATASGTIIVDQATTPVYGASVLTQNIPLRMTAGKAYPVQVSMQNTGSASWSGASFGLTSTNLPKALWRTTLTSLGTTESVAPDSIRIFSFQLRAPASVGTYSSSWRMLQNGGVGLFGQTLQVDGIEVTQCGNRVLDAGEACDDGNLAAGDGCSPACQHECGNGQLDAGEACDDGNVIAGDGCSPSCQRECGNGQIEPSEECDGGNFGGATCDSVTAGTKPLGSLSCTLSCTIDSSACTPAPSNCTDGVVFADPLLEQWVRDQLPNPSDPITPAEAAELGGLVVYDTPISSLEGLECFTNLLNLEIDRTQVSDLRPLANLTQLRSLWLLQNRITDLTPLANLTQLQDLELPDNQIGSLNGLSSMTQLMFLNFENNAVSALTPLTGLSAMQDLRFFGNQVSDLGPLASMPQLAYLDGGNNLIRDLTPLAGLTSLREVYLSPDNISTLAPLVQNTGVGAGDMVILGVDPTACPYQTSSSAALRARGVNLQTNCDQVIFADRNLESRVRAQLGKYTGPITPEDAAKLTSLVASSSTISSLSGLEYLTNLQQLDLSNNQVSDLAPLARLTQLRSLTLDNNAIADVTPLAGLTQLSQLALAHNQVRDVQPLASLTQMRELKLQDNQIESVNSLSSMTLLSSLAFDRNSVSSLAPLTGLSSITNLRFSGNRISDLSPLAAMPQLFYLDGSNNLISDLTPLAGLTMLQGIYLSGNQISTLAPLVQNTGVAGGDTVVLTRNPLACATEAGSIQTLTNRGVNVESDCGSGQSCVQRKLVGTYGLQAHNEVLLCQRSDNSCAADTIQDAPATFSLYTPRDNPIVLQGEFHGPGLRLHDVYSDSELWDAPAYFYYPEPGSAPLSIWTPYYPAGSVGDWDESRAGAWVRVLFDTCFEEFQTGFVHIDIELATGRVLDFARQCNVDYMTVWHAYRMSGTGRLECTAQACNTVENSASAAELVTVTQPDAMTVCQPTSGTYHLVSVHYFDGNYGKCEPPPAAIRETLVIDASTANTGTLNFATDEAPFAPFSMTFTYQAFTQPYASLQPTWTCGPEELTQLFGRAPCATSGNEFKIQLGRAGCDGSATYVYQKQ